jgi:PAS domain-containing protein
MSDPSDSASSWARRLTTLRALASRRGRADQPREVAEEALSLCDALVRELAGAQLACSELRAKVLAADAAWEHLFEIMPGACVLSDGAGVILKANPAASRLLNVSAAGLNGRELLVFSQDRQTFLALLREMGEMRRGELRAELLLRPRERKPVMTQLHVVAAPGREHAWLWMLVRAAATDAPAIDVGRPAGTA